MAVPNVADGEVSILKIARERTGAGYDSNFTITPPIYMSDISRVSGGNSSGSGRSYPAVNTLNPIANRPDGENPLRTGEFSEYNQNVARAAFQYIFNSSSSSNACGFGIPSGDAYYHTDSNNLVPDGTGIYYAYTTATGFNPVSAGYYSIYSNDNFPVRQDKWMYVNSSGLITQIGNC